MYVSDGTVVIVSSLLIIYAAMLDLRKKCFRFYVRIVSVLLYILLVCQHRRPTWRYCCHYELVAKHTGPRELPCTHTSHCLTSGRTLSVLCEGGICCADICTLPSPRARPIISGLPCL